MLIWIAMTTNGKRFRGIKAFVFDLDGTLIDSKLDLVLSMNATLEYLGRTALSQEQIASYVGGGVLLLVKRDRKSTRLNSSHPSISYAVFCLKKKKKQKTLKHI